MTKFDFNETFIHNMEKERYDLGMSQAEMARALDMSLSSYKRLINKTTDKVEFYIVYKLYLLTGKHAYEYANVYDKTIELSAKIKRLSPSQKIYIEALIDFELEFNSIHDNADDYVTVYVPTGNMEDGMIYDTSTVEKEEIPIYRKRYGEQIHCGIKITSNHLHPAYNLGDVLLISKRPIRDGDTGVFLNRDDGRIYIRKFHQTKPCQLEPINGYGETFYVDSKNKEDMQKWVKFGIVVSKVR